MRTDVRDWAAFERRHVHGRLSQGFGTWLFALLGTAGLAACSTPTGLMATGEPGQVCVPASVDGEATVGLDVLENFSSGPVKVTSATVADKKRAASGPLVPGRTRQPQAQRPERGKVRSSGQVPYLGPRRVQPRGKRQAVAPCEVMQRGVDVLVLGVGVDVEGALARVGLVPDDQTP